MICSNCRVLMRYVMRFEDGKAFELRRCPKCYYETRPIPLYFKDEKKTQQYECKEIKKRKPANVKQTQMRRKKKRVINR